MARRTGTASKAISILLRLLQLVSAVIVTGLLSYFFHLLNRGNGPHSGRLIYAEVVAVLGIVVALILLPPLRHTFYAWPLDFLMFVLWIVVFALLAHRSASCSSGWYYSYWGFYWGRFWRNPGFGNFGGRPGCSRWRTVLAFLFMGAMAWLASAILGLLVFLRHRRDTTTGTETRHASRAPMSDRFRMRRQPRGPTTQTRESTIVPEGPAV